MEDEIMFMLSGDKHLDRVILYELIKYFGCVNTIYGRTKDRSAIIFVRGSEIRIYHYYRKYRIVINGKERELKRIDSVLKIVVYTIAQLIGKEIIPK